MVKLDCQAVLFDLDGVLVDSSACIARHWDDWARQHGLDFVDFMDAAQGLRTVEAMRLVAPQADADAEAAAFAAAEVADTDGVTALEGALALLEVIPRSAWAVVTSAAKEVALARLRSAGLPVPAILVSAEDVSQGKPSPEPYLVAASRLGLPAHACLVIEDSSAGIDAGRRAGMHVIGIAKTHPQHELDCSIVVHGLSALRVSPSEGGANRLLILAEEATGGSLHTEPHISP